ncbi:HNH endonuclease signature motif containing protein [Sphaerimonospora mesophila]|uniref:HNH endonuclease signature motif containing protein n=1 Tax=Sphaerimonospora mesophila TaxID=37483 RepID=UPI001F42D897
MSQVREAALALAVTALPGSPEVCLAQVEELAFARDRLEAAIALRAARVHAAGAARPAGHASTRTWLRAVCGMSRRTAYRTVALGIELARLPDVQARYAAGNLTEAVVAAICAATTGLSDEDAAKAETILVELADSAGPQEIAKAGRYLRAVLDPDGEVKDADADYDARFLLLRETESGGVEGEFRLPREAAARLRALLDAYAKPKAQGDDRPLRVRNADTLIALLEQQITTELLVLINAESLPDDPTPHNSEHGTAPGESTHHSTTPRDTTPGDATPGDVAPGDVAPEDSASEDSASEGTTSGDTEPDDATPDGTASDDVTPGKTAPDDTASEDTVPGDAVPGDIAPDSTVPDVTMPEGTIPDGTMPEGTVPGDVAPGDAGRSDGPARATGKGTGPGTREDAGDDLDPDHASGAASVPAPAPESAPVPDAVSEPAPGFLPGAFPGVGRRDDRGDDRGDAAPGDDPTCGQGPEWPAENSREDRTPIRPATTGDDEPGPAAEASPAVELGAAAGTGGTDEPGSVDEPETESGSRTRTGIHNRAGEDEHTADTIPTGADLGTHRAIPAGADLGTHPADPVTGDSSRDDPGRDDPGRDDPGSGDPGDPGDPSGGDPGRGDPRGGVDPGGAASRGTGFRFWSVDGGFGDSGLGAGDWRWQSVLRTLPGLLLSTGHLLPITDIHRLARTSTLVRLVMNTEGQVLDMGRKTRLATPAQRRAIAARYDTCVVKGCPLPASMCQIDHIDNWSEGGRTDLARLGPMCQHHNRDRYRHPDRYQRRKIGPDRWEFIYIGPSPTRKHRSEPTPPPSERRPDRDAGLRSTPAVPAPAQCRP